MIGNNTSVKIKTATHVGIFLFFLLISFVINKIPSGKVIGGFDFIQFIFPVENLKRVFFTWCSITGQGTFNFMLPGLPFHIFQYILYVLGLSYSQIANTIIFVFLTGSFYSFYFAIRIINPEVSTTNRVLSSAIYALNIFTFSVLSLPWGYREFYLLYIFIPLLFAFYEKTLINWNFRNILLFSFVYLLSSFGFSNLAFLAALIVLEVIFIIISFLTKKVKISQKSILRIFLLFLIQFILSFYYTIPFVLSNWAYLSQLETGKQIVSYAKMLSLSPSIFNTISMGFTSSGYYPFINLFSSSKIFISLSTGYIFFIVLALLFQKKDQLLKWLNYLIIFVLLFFLLMRITPPFDKINNFIYYYIPIFKLFRSPVKLLIFFPFFNICLLSLLLSASKISKKVIPIILIFILLIPLPFYVGGIPKYLEKRDNIVHNRKYYTYLFNIPEEYNKAREITKDPNQLFVISLPHTGVFGGYSKWGFSGVDILYWVFNNYISPNTYDQPGLETKLSLKEYNDLGEINKEKFIGIIQKFSGKYILCHKDIESSYLESSKVTARTINILQNEKIIKKIDDNEYFNLYELSEKYLFPVISANNSLIYFQNISPVKYKILIPNLKGKVDIEFHQSYDTQWQIYVNSYNEKAYVKPISYYSLTNTYEIEKSDKLFEFSDIRYIFKKPVFDKSHIMVKDYANTWTIDSDFIKKNYSNNYYSENSDGSINLELTIYFKPQIYYYIGIILAGVLFIFLIAGLFYEKRKNRIQYRVEIEENK